MICSIYTRNHLYVDLNTLYIVTGVHDVRAVRIEYSSLTALTSWTPDSNTLGHILLCNSLKLCYSGLQNNKQNKLAEQ